MDIVTKLNRQQYILVIYRDSIRVAKVIGIGTTVCEDDEDNSCEKMDIIYDILIYQDNERVEIIGNRSLNEDELGKTMFINKRELLAKYNDDYYNIDATDSLVTINVE